MSRILIVDDHHSFRESARLLLEQRGYVVAGEAIDARTALEAVERLRPDGVLLDVQLGSDNGFTVCPALKRGRPELVVLLVSAADCHHAEPLLGASGACGFVEKSELGVADLERVWPLPAVVS
jgi:DNA-binding NarL/FixJ family response regulator